MHFTTCMHWTTIPCTALTRIHSYHASLPACLCVCDCSSIKGMFTTVQYGSTVRQANSLSIHGPFTVHSLSIHCPFTVHSLSIHCPFTVHSLSIHCPLTLHSLSIHCPFTVHSLSHSLRSTLYCWYCRFHIYCRLTNTALQSLYRQYHLSWK